MKKVGTLYGVSIGPGDPELLTVKAIKTIRQCPVLAAPKTHGERSTLALDIVREAVDLTGKELLPLPFTMSRSPEERAARHRELAQVLAQPLSLGRDVALINLGDISIFSTFSYLMEQMVALGYPVEIIPGVPSFCAVAAALKQSLTTIDQPLQIIPAGYGCLEEALDLPGTKVLMKPGSALPEVKETLERRGLAQRASLVKNCGLPDEQICPSLEADSGKPSYFTTILIRDR